MKSGSANEYEALNISCSSGTIDIYNATWGKKKPTSTKDYIRVKDQVKNRCNGKKTCSIQADNSSFGSDPAPGASKKLEVSYFCY